MRKRYLLAMGLLAMGLACSGCSKSSGQLDGGIIRIAYNQAPTHPHYQALERAGERFKEATGGRYEFLIYPNEVLGDQRATLELIQNGAIQMAIVNNAMVENYNKDFSILGLPYIFDSQEHQKEVFTSGILDPLFESTKEEGFEVMAAYTAGSRNVYTGKPIETPKDLDGMKIRVMESPTMVAMMKYMGGVGTPMSQGEVYTAIQQGVLDGGENNEITYVDLKHYEVAPVFSKTQHVTNLHLEMERILFICLRRVLQTEPAFVHITEKRFKIHIPCKAVGRHAVFFPIMDIRSLITFSHKRKKHRGVSVPHRRFSAPKHFAVRFLVINPGKFCTAAGNSN